MPSSKGSSQLRDPTCVSCISCIGGRILYRGATWEAPHKIMLWMIKAKYFHFHRKKKFPDQCVFNGPLEFPSGFPDSSVGKEFYLQSRRSQFDSWVRNIHWRRDRLPTSVFLGFPCGSAGKESLLNVGDLGSIPGLGRSPGEGKGYPLQYSPWGHKESNTTEGLSLEFPSQLF